MLALGLSCALSAQSPEWRGWDSYQAIMWSTGTARDNARWLERLREAGFTAEQCPPGRDPSPFLRAGLGFYVENLVAELAYLHDRRALYDADWQAYTSTRDKANLTRRPCLDDLEAWDRIRIRVESQVRPFINSRPLMYDLRDELSIGTYASPMDYCFGPHTLRAFREWLKQQYGPLEALNSEWETSFAGWDEVQPMTTYEVKDRERAALAAGRPENYAPWADHRAFMDATFSRTLDMLRQAIRRLDPAGPVGVEGAQMPSAWGGYDLWRMANAVDWIEPYDIANSREIFRSFLPEGAPVVSTAFGSDFPHLRQKLWWLAVHGDRGVIVWDDEQSRAIEKDAAEMPLTERGRWLKAVLEELRAAAPRMFTWRRVDDRIAIHYSQASIRAHWMFDSREDRDTWPRRFSSYEANASRIARVRDSFIRVIEDLGLQYNFVSYEQIENGELINSGYRALLLPQSVAMSEKECAAVEQFIREGGAVIADNMTATMDEHCRRLGKGRLDEMFGIRRSGTGWRARAAAGTVAGLPAFEPDIEAVAGEFRKSGSGAPAVIRNGRAVYLNIGMHDYGRLRLNPPGGEEYRKLFAEVLAGLGIEPEVRVLGEDGAPAPCVEVWRYRDGDAAYLAVMRNPEFRAAELKPAGYTGNAAIETTIRVRIVPSVPAAFTDFRTGERLSESGELEAELEPWFPLLYRLEPMP